jgi:opacity protein-like surface antigen
MKIQKSWMAACLIAACAVNAQAQNSYAEIAFQTIDMGFKSNAAGVRGVFGTRLNDWMDVEGMIGVGTKEAKGEREFLFGVPVEPTANVDRFVGVYAKPKLVVGNGMELFGRVGYATTQISVKASAQQGNQYVSRELTDTESALSYGFGASYALTKSFIISADFMNIAEDVDAMSVGIRYAF